MKRFFYLWIACMITIAALVACTISAQQERESGTEVPSDDFVRLASAETRRPGADLGGDDVAALVQGNNAFAADLYHAASAGDDNLIFSPYSISLAFSMAYAGARGETQAQMQDVLNFLKQERQHAAFNGLERHLATLSEGHVEGEETGPAFQLDIANSVWGQRGAPFQETYLQTLAVDYGAGLNTVDFSVDPEAARQAINAWIREATQEKIENLIAPGVLTPQTQLVLANAITFYGAWQQPFDDQKTKDGAFTLLDGAQVNVPLMRESTLRVPYGEGDGYRTVLLPYTGQKADMLLILPDEGRFAQVQQRLSADFVSQALAATAIRDVDLILPRFSFQSDLNLARTLPDMGLANPFGPQADFSGILPGGGLFVDAASHKATISVDERGTEASAATIIAMAVSEIPRAQFHATRPFILAIVERETGAILFLGRLTNPA